jgi:hypothetical protein
MALSAPRRLRAFLPAASRSAPGAFDHLLLAPLVLGPGRLDRLPVHPAVVDKAGVLRRHDGALEVRADLVVVDPLRRPAPVLSPVRLPLATRQASERMKAVLCGSITSHQRDAQQEEQLQGHTGQQHPQQPAPERPHVDPSPHCAPDSWVCRPSSRVKRKRDTTTIWSACRRMASLNRRTSGCARWPRPGGPASGCPRSAPPRWPARRRVVDGDHHGQFAVELAAGGFGKVGGAAVFDLAAQLVVVDRIDLFARGRADVALAGRAFSSLMRFSISARILVTSAGASVRARPIGAGIDRLQVGRRHVGQLLAAPGPASGSAAP